MLTVVTLKLPHHKLLVLFIPLDDIIEKPERSRIIDGCQENVLQ
jgi:hypothetical protein